MIICVCGPTGIGKTRLSEFLAEKYNGIVLNADATQIYKYLDIGSAKITKEEMGERKHFLFDIKNPDEDYSVMEYQIDARNILKEYENQNIIVVGGTGLYIKALFYDYKFNKLNEENFENYSNEQLYLMAKEKGCNNIHQNNRVRLINYLKRDDNKNNKDKSLYDVIYIGLTAPREKIYETVNNRVDIMLNNGLEKEVKDLYLKYPNSNILKRAIGYKELIDYFNNKVSYEKAIENIKKNTRHYVKRQYTWFNNQLNVNWFNVNFDNFQETEEEISSFIDSLNSK